MNVIFFVLFQSFLNLCYCANKNHDSLVVTQENDKFHLTKLNEYNLQLFRADFLAPQNGLTYHFCPCTEVIKKSNLLIKNALCETEKIKSTHKTTSTKKCQHEIEPVFVKVKNSSELKSNWNNNKMELYHSGFLLFVENLIKTSLFKRIWNYQIRSQLSEPLKPTPEYEEWNSNYALVLGLSIYYNTEMKQTVAVEYELLSTQAESSTSEITTNSFKEVLPLGKPPFHEYCLNKNYLTFMKEKIGNWRTYLNEEIHEDRNELCEIPLAPSEHFKVPLWKKAIEIMPNLGLSWYDSTYTWSNVGKFAEIVAKFLGDLKIITGEARIMSLPYADDNTLKLNEHAQDVLLKNDKMTIPRYLWTIFEHYRDEQWYGILVIMHVNIFVDDTINICEIDVCEQNGWKISNSNIRAGKIYCCEMKNEYIKQLEADYLSLEEPKVFNLNNWAEQNNLIYNYYITKG